MKKLYSQWVPHLLTVDQNSIHAIIVELLAQGSERFFAVIYTYGRNLDLPRYIGDKQ